jgi:hypothetical protein
VTGAPMSIDDAIVAGDSITRRDREPRAQRA